MKVVTLAFYSIQLQLDWRETAASDYRNFSRKYCSPFFPLGTSLISTQIARASTAVLIVGGLLLLFAADAILPRLIPTFPAAGAWLGQLLGASWLAVAALNWLSRRQLIGGIYGRPVVMANAALFFIAALVILKIIAQPQTPMSVWFVFAPAVLFAAIYGWLMFRGPFERDLQSYRGAKEQG